jgi:hypothetical protein
MHPFTPPSQRGNSFPPDRERRSEHGATNPATPLIIVILVVGLVGVPGFLVCLYLRDKRTVAYVRVIRTPPGEAPEEIRRAWIGVELPLRRYETNPQCHVTEGVLSGQSPGMPPEFVDDPGYAVSGKAAVKALAAHCPEAAEWWFKNAPRVVASGYQLWFPAGVCEKLGGPAAGPENKDDAWIGLGSDDQGGVWKRDVPPWER